MKFRVLGPLEIEVSGKTVVLSAAKERAVLAALLARRNQVVSVDDLVEVVWGDDPPRTAGKTLQTYVSQLRRALGDDGRIDTRPRGYVLRIPADHVDAGVFERLVSEGRTAFAQGDAGRSSRLLADGLALWRGRAFEEVADRGYLVGESVRLEEQRLLALEDRIEADILQGRHRDLIGELEAAVGEHPLRERLWGQLMVVLYRSGRQADALQAFQRARRVLVDELGIEPGPELRRIESGVLSQEPVLEAPAPGVVAAERPPRTRYATCGDVHVAYQVVGEGGADILFVNDWYSHVEVIWEHPIPAQFVRQLSDVGRLVLFDGRGTGLSDPVDRGDPVTVEQWIDDGRAVLDDLGIDRVTLFGSSVGAAMCVLFAATRPERVRGIVMLNGVLAFGGTAPGHAGFDALLGRFLQNWGRAPALEAAAPSILDDPGLLAWFGRYQRMSASPGSVAGRLRMVSSLDVRQIASTLEVPALALHRRGNRIVPLDVARPAFEAMPLCKVVELPGEDHVWFATQDGAEIAAHVSEFVADAGSVAQPERVLASILAIQLLPSGSRDHRRRQHDAVMRQVELHRGRQVHLDDNSSLHFFAGPASAIGCASRVLDVVLRLGGEARAGVHVGETQLGGEETSVAADVAYQVAGLAAPGEVWVTSTVVDLVAGSGLEFTTRGDHHLSDHGGARHLFSLNI